MSNHKRCTLPQGILINEELKKCLIPTNDGKWDYKPGETDKTIAQRVGTSYYPVGEIRKKLYGEISNPKKHAFASNKRIDDIEFYCLELSEKLNKLQEQVNRIRTVCNIVDCTEQKP